MLFRHAKVEVWEVEKTVHLMQRFRRGSGCHLPKWLENARNKKKG